MSMKKSMILFTWFLKFGVITPRDDYSVHDHIKAKFCPEYMTDEEFDEKEQLLRDTPGPVAIKYAYFVGSKVNGMSGAFFAMFATLLPVIIMSAALIYAYPVLFDSGATMVTISAIGGIHAVTLGLIASHLLKVVHFNKTTKKYWSNKSLFIILPSAFIFLFLPDILGINSAHLMPVFIAAVIIAGIVMGFAHKRYAEYLLTKPPKYIDPHSRKGKKLRARQLREEEWELKKYRDDERIKKRKEQVDEEAAEEARKKRRREGREE